MLFNVGGGAILLTVVGYAITSFFTTPAVMPCTSRFPSGVQLAFARENGKLLSPVELQARSGSREWGLLKNAHISPSAQGTPSGGALEVKLASTENEDQTSQNGVGFIWQLPEVAKASSACLSYSAFVPADFKFNEPGYLPGLFGAADVTQIDELQPEDSFAIRMGWAEAGDVGIDVRVPTSAGYWEGAAHKKLWPTGRWVKVEQEVRLNTPGQDNGALRLWIDGGLIINRAGIELRKTSQSQLSGVVSDIGYARTLSDVAVVKVSPFIVQWQ